MMLYLKPSFSDIALLYPTEYRLAATITEPNQINVTTRYRVFSSPVL